MCILIIETRRVVLRSALRSVHSTGIDTPPRTGLTSLQALYFGPVGRSTISAWTGTSGGYSAVYAALATASPPVIDWFNVQ